MQSKDRERSSASPGGESWLQTRSGPIAARLTEVAVVRLFLFCALIAALAADNPKQGQGKPRARDLGVPFEGIAGPLNAITEDMHASFTPPPNNDRPNGFGADVTLGDWAFPQGLRTINGAGDVVIIGVGTVGQFVLQGQASFTPPPDGDRVQGNYMIAFFGGMATP